MIKTNELGKGWLCMLLAFTTIFNLQAFAQDVDPVDSALSASEDSHSQVIVVDESSQDKVVELSGDVFHNINAKDDEKAAKVMWSIDYDEVSKIENVIIRYKRKIDKKKPWKYTEVIATNKVSFKIEDLKGGEKYVWEVGCAKDGSDINAILSEGEPNGDRMVWSKQGKFATDRSWGLFKLLVLIGALGMFIYGMKLMSEGLQQTAGGRLRQILGSMTANRYLGVLSGFLITALVQSSSATTVMTVSFVNAGLLSLVESAGVMMGANIGTTITGWLVSIFGFKISLASYSLIFIAIGAPLMFMPKKNLNAWSSAIIGFALLFLGLGELKDAVPELGADSAIIEFFSGFGEYAILGRIMFVILGTLVTIIVQSSSAAMALTLTMVLNNIIPFDVAAAMILGENIGTTITAELASLVGNVHAKRSARIHSLFNIVGVTWMVFALPLFLNGIEYVMTNYMDFESVSRGEGATVALAAFHTTFNLTNVLIMIWFSGWLVKVATRTVKSKGEEDEIFKLEYIHGGLLATPELSVLEARKEVVKFAQLNQKMLDKVRALLNETDEKQIKKLIKKIAKYEDITDNLEHEINEFLSNVSASELSESSAHDLRAIISIINDLERIGDIFFQISKMVEKKVDNRVWFEQEQRDKLNELIGKLNETFVEMIKNLNKKYSDVSIDRARELENELNKLRNGIRKHHLKAVEAGKYTPNTGLVYSNLFSSLERAGDHVINVSEAITGINLM